MYIANTTIETLPAQSDTKTLTMAFKLVITQNKHTNMLSPALIHADLFASGTKQYPAKHSDCCWFKANVSPANSPARH